MFGAVPPPKYRYFDTAVFCSTFERFFFGKNLIFGRETESDYDRGVISWLVFHFVSAPVHKFP